MLPSVSPLTVSWMKVSTRAPSLCRRSRAARRAWPGRPSVTPLLLDQLVVPVGLDLEDVEPSVQRVVRPRRELEVAAEDPVLDVVRLLDVAEDRQARDGAPALRARELDRAELDLHGAVGRRTERADLLAGVVLQPARDDR